MIDAGEASIGVSGDINIFVLEVVNAIHMQVKGVGAVVNVQGSAKAQAAAGSIRSRDGMILIIQ